MLPEPALTIFRLTPFLLFWWLRVTPMKSHSHFLIIRSLYFFLFLRARFDLRIWFLFWPASLVTLCLFSLLSGLAAAALASLTLFLFFVRSFFIAFLSIRIFSMTHGIWNHASGTFAFLERDIWEEGFLEPHIWDSCLFEHDIWDNCSIQNCSTTHLGHLRFWNVTSGKRAFLEPHIWDGAISEPEILNGTTHLGRGQP